MRFCRNTVTAINDFQSPEFVGFLEQLTGFRNLIPDKPLTASGLHPGLKGGFLNVHGDFTTHYVNNNLRRRVNVLLYLNKDWKEEYGGAPGSLVE